MSEFLYRFPTDDLIGLVAVVGAFFCGTLGLVLAFCCQYWSQRQAETAAALKRDMLSRGIDVGEICAVMEAGTSQSGKRCRKRESAG